LERCFTHQELFPPGCLRRYGAADNPRCAGFPGHHSEPIHDFSDENLEIRNSGFSVGMGESLPRVFVFRFLIS
jgi:hypothetical protein